MSAIPSFKASLIQSYDPSKPSTAPTVEEILERTPSPVVSTESETPAKKGIGIVPKVVTAGVALAALGYAGRKGWLSKRVQRILGGKPKATKEQIKEKIDTALREYIGRNSGGDFTMRVLKNGKIHATRVDANGITERITFNSNTGVPEMRILMTKAKGKGKPMQYTVWKGADILDEGFDEVNNYYKIYSRSGAKREHLFGPKVAVEDITYGTMARGTGNTQIHKEIRYYKDGTVDRVQVSDGSTGGNYVQDMLYGKDGKLKGLDVISDDGNVIRTVLGGSSVPVREANRKTSKWQKFFDLFSRSKKNIIE